MFCPKCGHEMIPNGRFCTHCGADVQSMIQMPKDGSSQADHTPEEVSKPVDNAQKPNEHKAEVERRVPAVQEGEKTGESNLAAIIGKNQAYYCAEFEKIAAGQKPRFNWAAFLLGPGMCFYRKCENLFKKYFSLSLILYFIGFIVEIVGSVQFNFMLMAIGGVVIGIGGVLMLVNSIRFGSQFNRLYHQHCKTPHTSKFGVSMKNMVIYYVAVVGLSLLISFAGTVIARQQYANILDQDTSMDEPSDTITPEIQEDEPSNAPTEQENTPVPIQEDDGLFKDFIGSWEDDYGVVRVIVYYSDETQQQAYAEASTPAGLFTAELTLAGAGEAHGAVVYGSEPAYTIDLKKNSGYLDADIYYPDHDFTYSVKLVPIEPGNPTDSFNQDNIAQPFDQFVGDWYSDEGITSLFIGYGDETKQTTYGMLLTLEAIYEDIEMWTQDGKTIYGLLMGYDGEPLLELTLIYDGYGLDGEIQYSFSDIKNSVYFTPYISRGFQNPYYTN